MLLAHRVYFRCDPKPLASSQDPSPGARLSLHGDLVAECQQSLGCSQTRQACANNQYSLRASETRLEKGP
ncbi:MAG: hypothetical protein ACI9BV_003248 [Rhodothermales bacterium]